MVGGDQHRVGDSYGCFLVRNVVPGRSVLAAQVAQLSDRYRSRKKRNTHGLTYGFTSVRTPIKNSVPVARRVLTLCNFIGLDILQPVCDSLYEEFKQDECFPRL